MALSRAWDEVVGQSGQSGMVRVGVVLGEGIAVLADLEDSEIVATATEDGSRLWEMGDTLEVFIGTPGDEGYFEFHISANSRKLALRYPNREAIAIARASGSIEPYLIHDCPFQGSAWLTPSGWSALAAIPFKVFDAEPTPGLQAPWRIAICRYDYARSGGEPEVSSTAPFTKLDFHRFEEWNRLTFDLS